MRAFSLFLVVVFGCAPAVVPLTQTLTFSREAGALLDAAEDDGALVAVWVGDATTGKTLFAHRDATRFLPASTLKVVTTAAALAHLGEDFRFRTPVWLDGIRKDDAFIGNLIVEASGDPSLGSWRWPETESTTVCDRVADALLERGIRRWEGRVEVRTDQLAVMGPGWAWDDAWYDYSAVPSQFVFHENVIDLRLTRAPSCGPASVEVTPSVPGFSTEVFIEAADRRSVRCRAHPDGAQCRWHAPESTCPKQASIRLATSVAPAMFEACVDAAVERKGILRAAKRFSGSSEQAPLLVLESPPLTQLVHATNKESLNLYAERLALELAMHLGVAGYDGVGAALREDLLERGVHSRDVMSVDGSGLSRYNLATPRALGRVLVSSVSSSYALALIDSLPVAGEDGTLARRRLSPAAAGRVRAKSGSMTGHRSWAGIVERPGDPEHPQVVFALMVGNMHEPSLSPNVLFERFASALVSLPIR